MVTDQLCSIWHQLGWPKDDTGEIFLNFSSLICLVVHADHHWDLSQECQLEHLHMTSSYFLTTWQIDPG